MKIFKLYVPVFALLLTFQVGTTYATDYNYLPNDIFLKQQEEKSALEYRLKTLENQSQSNPQASILSIEQRISELQRQKDTEKEYLKGTLAKNGAYSPETFASYSAKIDAKYDPQISSLNQQKSSYQSQSSSQQNSQEISDLKLEIAKLKAEMVGQELKRNLEALEKYQVKDTSKVTTYYSDEEVQKLFNYIDSLSISETGKFVDKIKEENKDVVARLIVLQNNKYPNGKVGTGKHDDYLKSLGLAKTIETKTVVVPPKVEPIKKASASPIKTTKEVKKDVVIEQKVATTSILKTEPVVSTTPVEVKPTLGKKVKGFFKKWFGR